MSNNLSDSDIDLIKNWLNKNFLQIINETEGLHSITTDIPSEFGRSRARDLSHTNSIDVKVHENHDKSQIKLDIFSEIVIILSIHFNISDYDQSEDVRLWVGDIKKDFADYSSELETQLRTIMQITFSKTSKKILNCECKSIEGDYGSIKIN